jgi:hypothetical protein
VPAIICVQYSSYTVHYTSVAQILLKAKRETLTALKRAEKAERELENMKKRKRGDGDARVWDVDLKGKRTSSGTRPNIIWSIGKDRQPDLLHTMMPGTQQVGLEHTKTVKQEESSTSSAYEAMLANLVQMSSKRK